MYARVMVEKDPASRSRLVNFFQYLTQAAVKADQCCVVASLLATDPKKSDRLGKEIQAELYDIFQRQREETVHPVQKEDIAELLRRRFFTPESIKDREAFRSHTVAALEGIRAIDERTRKDAVSSEERFIKNYPFHPDLTDVLYSKWTALERFQRTRGVLRTFALALREAETWDKSPLIGANVFLTAPKKKGLCEAGREMVTVAETESYEGKRQAWTPILETELAFAREIQAESVGLKFREIEQAVWITFLHSQPIGQNAKLRDITVLLGATRPDKIELEKGLIQWARDSHWLDDLYANTSEGEVPQNWRLGIKPNLNQMHSAASRDISGDIVEARLLDEIEKQKSLTKDVSKNYGIKVHILPAKPGDIEDNGEFHFAILGPSASSASGKPGPEARRFLEEKAGTDSPRVHRNALVLVAPSRQGLDIARNRIRGYLAWEKVHSDMNQQEGKFDPTRMSNLTISLNKAKGRIPEAIRQAYCIVVTVSEKSEIQAFKITLAEESLFDTIKADSRARIQDTAVTADTLLPDGPYDLWQEGDTARWVKDLVGAFAQLPHLPKMLNAKAILDTLIDGCVRGTFVLRITRPDHTFRTWWMRKPDDDALKDPALEVVLPEAATLNRLQTDLLLPDTLPDLWKGDDILVRDIAEYFGGSTVVQIEKDGYEEPLQIPKAERAAIEETIHEAVKQEELWLLSGPSSIFGEEIPPGVLTDEATLRKPPRSFKPVEILSENLPEIWKDGSATALSIAAALSHKEDIALPWKIIRTLIDSALDARFVELDTDSGHWPSGFQGAGNIKLRELSTVIIDDAGIREVTESGVLAANTDLEPAQIQDLGEAIPDLLKIKAESDIPMRFHVRIEVGEALHLPDETTIQKINEILTKVHDGLRLSYPS